MIEATKYTLKNIADGREFEDEGWMLADPQCKEASLVRAIYNKKQIEFKDSSCGFYKYADWLPIKKTLAHSSAPVTYKSTALASKLGMSNLYITFSGWWPKIGASFKTCSFKETEAYSVCARLGDSKERILVVASAGNTARAFAQVCSDNNIPIVIAIPYDNLSALWFEKPLNKCVKIICSPAGTDYFDAIRLGDKVCTSKRFLAEGGAKNVARRDGMATTVLSAVEKIGRIPDAYFQAIGSGTGTIAAWEANLRLIEDGRFGKHLMKLIPSQNDPFTPMYDSFKADSRKLILPEDENTARELALKINAKVLSNRKPPYSLAGGLYDALKSSNGDMEKVTNEELAQACAEFLELEGIDIHPAAGVAVKSLEKALASGKISKDSVVMLNITGGGEQLFKKEHKCIQAQPDLVLSPDTAAEEVVSKVIALF